MRRAVAIGAMVVAASGGTVAVAAPPAPAHGAVQGGAADIERGPAWSTLSRAQQSALKPLERD
ncbi:MAG: hypothetical protein K2Y02_03575, partial [Burkholderiaceae bacterium]|nr:hypothetical protein [Burkholderiaceae bacterium]